MTPTEHIEHIRRCLRGMRPVMSCELHAVEEIEKDLRALEQYIGEQETGDDNVGWW